ncbi:MAG: TrlF family AAA-like ATPase [Myxococcota bacterium]
MSYPPVRYPGARWWKFDFHTHTPASSDTSSWQRAKGTLEEVTPETWLSKFMAAGIDCVAVTDHNSGAWIDRLREAHAKMRGEPGYREIELFPGVEISVQGGVHVLALLGPGATTSDIDTLLGSVGYRGTKGDSDEVTTRGLLDVLSAILDNNAVPIPAHADGPKGLLECVEGSRQGKFDANTLRQALDIEGLLAVEWGGATFDPPDGAAAARRLSRVLGSDTHSFRGKRAPGSAFTWVKMAHPTLEGLLLALLDGNGISIRRSDEGPFDPDRLPAHTIAAIEIETARYIGNQKSARLDLSPFFNAIVGGRGTGKSTVVHALRLAAGRGAEPQDGTEPRTEFDTFRKVPKGRGDKGALRDSTRIAVEWRHEAALLRLVWKAGGPAVVVVEQQNDGAWVPTASQAVNAARFPLRILSQGQIATIAGEGRRALLAIIDEAAGVHQPRLAWDEACRVFLEQRARLRTMEGRVGELPEVERKLAEADAKLETFSREDHAAVLRAYAHTQSQTREVQGTFDQARGIAARIGALVEEFMLDDWSAQLFTDADADLLAWRADVDKTLHQLRERLLAEAGTLRTTVDGWNQDARFKAWRARQQAASQAHEALQAQLTARGVQDPGAFERLSKERQALDQKKKELTRLEADRETLLREINAQRALVAARRADITTVRENFVARTLQDNPHVRITVEPHGYDSRQIERELRELLDVTDDRFATDILTLEGDEERGMARDLAFPRETPDKVAVLERVREQLIQVDASFNGHFRNHLTRKHKQPEFSDHVLAWSPEDDLRIEYQRDRRWVSIEQGSQGQRSAALLAFLLAFGEEPLVLDQPEDDLDNHLIYDLIVQQIRENKLRRQLVIVTHNANVVVNGDAELVHVMEFIKGQCVVMGDQSGALQEERVRQEVCRVMEGGQEAFARRWKRLGRER